MADVQFIMERVAPGSAPECFKMWACRGAGRGCTRNTHRAKKAHCADCVGADDPNETLEQLMARMKRGDA